MIDHNRKVQVAIQRFKRLGWKVARTNKDIHLVGRKENELMAVIVANGVEKSRTDELISEGFDKVMIFDRNKIVRFDAQLQRFKEQFESEGWKMIILKPKPDFIAIEYGHFTAVCVRMWYTNAATNNHATPYQNKSFYKKLKELHLNQGFENVTIFIHHRPRHSKLGDLVVIPVLNEPKSKLYRPVYSS